MTIELISSLISNFGLIYFDWCRSRFSFQRVAIIVRRHFVTVSQHGRLIDKPLNVVSLNKLILWRHFSFVTTKLPRRKNSKISRAIQAAVHEERRQRQRLEQQQQQQRAGQERQPENQNREQRLQDAVDEAHRHLAVILAARNEQLELQIHADPNELPEAHEDPQADK